MPNTGDSIAGFACSHHAAPGSMRYYQSYYRDPLASFCPPLTFNSSNGIIVQW